MAKEKSKSYQERRSGKERRQYEYALHIPERRRGKDRRRGDKEQKPEALEEGNALEKGNQEKAKKTKN